MESWEQRLVSALKTGKDWQQILREERDGRFLYCLSPLRTNLIRWMSADPHSRVLEVCGGHGELTGFLAETAGEVCSMYASPSAEAAAREKNRVFSNIRYLTAEDLRDLPNNERFDRIYVIPEPDELQAYDQVLLYPGDPSGDSAPADRLEEALRYYRGWLKEDGILIWAADNREGMRVLAGANPGRFSLYPADAFAIPEKAGFHSVQTYYPYPDYFFAETLFSDARLPEQEELSENGLDFLYERTVRFDEETAYGTVLRNGWYPKTANSWLFVLGSKADRTATGGIDYCKFSNQRDSGLSIRTEISYGSPQGGAGIAVRKVPDNRRSIAHVAGLEEKYQMLSRQYASSRIQVNTCRIEGEAAVLDYVSGTSMENLLDDLLDRGRIHEAGKLVQELFAEFEKAEGLAPFAATDRFHKVFGRLEEPLADVTLPCTDVDLVFANVIRQGDKWILLDYEWSFDFPIPFRYICYRALFYYGIYNPVRQGFVEDQIRKLGFTRQEITAYQRMESAFQQYITGDAWPLRIMNADFGIPVLTVQEMSDYLAWERSLAGAEMFWDAGCGYEISRHRTLEPVEASGWTEICFEVPDEAIEVRIDPANVPGILSLRMLVDEDGTDVGFSSNGYAFTDGLLLFSHNDPQILVQTRACGIRKLRMVYRYDGVFQLNAKERCPLRFDMNSFGDDGAGIRERIGGIEKENNVLKEKIRQLEEENEGMRTIISAMHERITGMENSTSWKVTAPLRRLGGSKNRNSSDV